MIATITTDLDGDGLAETVSLDAKGVLSGKGGRGGQDKVSFGVNEKTAQMMDGPLLTSATMQSHTLRTGGTVLLATAQRLKGPKYALAAVWRNEKWFPIHTGSVGPVGSDGEYSMFIEFSGGELVRFQTTPSVARCDGEQRLFLERFSMENDGAIPGRWLPWPEGCFPDSTSSQNLEVLTTAPSGFSKPSFGAYRLVGGSRQTGVARADLLTAPHELDDGSDRTAWRLDHPASGTFFTWRSESRGRLLRAIRIIAAPTKIGTLPTQMLLSLPDKRHFSFSLSSGSPSSGRTSGPFWVVLPQPVPTDCVSLTITGTATNNGDSTALAEVNLYSDLDGEAALERFVDLLGEIDNRNSDAAERALNAQVENRPAQIAEKLVPLLAAKLQTTRGTTRRKILGILKRLGPHTPGFPIAIQHQLVTALVDAVQTAEIDDRAEVLLTLEQATSQDPTRSSAVVSLWSLALDEKKSLPLRKSAAAWVLQHSPFSDGLQKAKQLVRDARLRKTALSAFATKNRCMDTASENGRLAIGELLRSDADAAWSVWLFESLSESQVGCSVSVHRENLASHLAHVWKRMGQPFAEDERFALRYRLLRAFLRLNSPTPSVTVFDVARTEKEPVLRVVAAEAVAQFQPLHQEWIAQVLSDTDPGVRKAMLAGLFHRREKELFSVVAPRLLQERWPMVRRAAAELIGSICSQETSAVSLLEQAISDSDESVAALSLQGLSRCLGNAGFSRYLTVLQNQNNFSHVRGHACVLVARHGLPMDDQSKAARQAIENGLGDLLYDPLATDRSLVGAILCIRAVGEYGKESELGLIIAHLSPDAPLALRRSAGEAVLKLCERQRNPFGPPAKKTLEKLLAPPGDENIGLLRGLWPKWKKHCGPWLAPK